MPVSARTFWRTSRLWSASLRLTSVLRRNRSGVQFAMNFQPPAPHLGYGAVAHQKGGVLLAQPLQDLERHAGLRPRLDLARMNDAAIAEAGFECGALLALDDFDFMAPLGQE